MGDRITLRDQWGNLAVTITCKGIVFENNKIWLRKNERDDWELPGGRLGDSEQPEQTVARELSEELGAKVSEPQLVDVCVWQKDFGTTTHIAVVTFRVQVISRTGNFENIGEAGQAEFRLFNLDEALDLPNLPDIYKRALKKL